MEHLTMITLATILGLVLTGLLLQVLNHLRLMTVARRQETTEARILARLMILETAMTDQHQEMEITMEGTPVTLEDLIRADLEEQMTEANQTMATPEELTRVMKDLLDPKGTTSMAMEIKTLPETPEVTTTLKTPTTLDEEIPVKGMEAKGKNEH